MSKSTDSKYSVIFWLYCVIFWLYCENKDNCRYDDRLIFFTLKSGVFQTPKTKSCIALRVNCLNSYVIFRMFCLCTCTAVSTPAMSIFTADMTSPIHNFCVIRKQHGWCGIAQKKQQAQTVSTGDIHQPVCCGGSSIIKLRAFLEP